MGVRPGVQRHLTRPHSRRRLRCSKAHTALYHAFTSVIFTATLAFIFVQIITRLLERLSAVKIGDSLGSEMLAHEGAAMGPVVSRPQFDKIWAYIDEAIAGGLPLLYGGNRGMVTGLGKGYFIPPTVFADVPTDAKVWNEEIFGPVLCLRRFSSEQEALVIANANSYGLAGAVFSQDAARCTRVAAALRCGIVWKNCSQVTIDSTALPTPP